MYKKWTLYTIRVSKNSQIIYRIYKLIYPKSVSTTLLLGIKIQALNSDICLVISYNTLVERNRWDN